MTARPTILKKLVVIERRFYPNLHMTRQSVLYRHNTQNRLEGAKRTGTEIVVPSGAEQEKVSATLGPALASDVLAQLLDGSPYNLIILGSFEDSSSLNQVILTPKVPGVPPVNPMAPPPPPPAPKPESTPPQRLVEQAPPATPGSGADQVNPGQPGIKTPPPDQPPPN